MTGYAAEVTREFHRLYYERGVHANYGQGLHAQTRYHGVETHKCPLDLWIYQEILFELKPALVIEHGTYLGGTTLFLAHQLDALGSGHLLSIDVAQMQRPDHPRVIYVHGSSTDDRVLEDVRETVASASGHVIVIHDADHRFKNVVADLDVYHSFVTAGSYLIVEDTNVNGHPVLVDWGPGPWEAVDHFLERHSEFERDHSREKFLLTYHPGGYLRRRAV